MASGNFTTKPLMLVAATKIIQNIDLLKTLKLNCNSLIITRDNIINFNENDYLLKARFDVNPIEKLAHYLNPINNARRVPLNVWGCNNNL